MIKATICTGDGKRKRIQGKDANKVVEKVFDFSKKYKGWVHVRITKQSDEEVDK